ncbi:MAG: hypothetical protein C0467_21800 [Planctomycetaceae bacterium]|nr:hypothetical protein [Planctomycetaceae bacterium]
MTGVLGGIGDGTTHVQRQVERFALQKAFDRKLSRHEISKRIQAGNGAYHDDVGGSRTIM